MAYASPWHSLLFASSPMIVHGSGEILPCTTKPLLVGATRPAAVEGLTPVHIALAIIRILGGLQQYHAAVHQLPNTTHNQDFGDNHNGYLDEGDGQ